MIDFRAPFEVRHIHLMIPRSRVGCLGIQGHPAELAFEAADWANPIVTVEVES